MKYTGRITLIILLFVIAVLYTLAGSLTNDRDFPAHVLVPFILSPVCWYIGRQYDKVKYFSEKDALTETNNRRFAERMFPKLCALSDRHNKKLGLLMLDINDFKVINDKYGHKEGDRVLQKISNLLNQFTRKSDVVSRWGGDEFIIIAPLMDQKGISAFISRVQKGVEGIASEVKTELGVSIGSAIYPEDGTTLDELIQVADKNMYQIKNLKS